MYDPLPFLLAQAAGKDAAKPAAPAAPAPADKPGVAPAPAKDPQGPGGGGFGDYSMFLPIAAILVVFYLIVVRPQRKEQQNQSEMLKQLKKNDRVLTIGGIIGTVANISQDGKEVTLKIDDNARMHVIRNAIQSVLKDEKAGETKT